MSWLTREKIVEKFRDQVVIGDAATVTLYRVMGGDYCEFLVGEVAIATYLSCEEAFKNHPGAKVVQQRAVRIGDEYFLTNYLTRTTVTKPKIPKGRTKATKA